MKRNIISIDEDKCNGCGLCISACHEGALKLVDGKAKLISESYCDGLGDCLPECPTGAIEIVEKDVMAYDEKAVEENIRKREEANKKEKVNFGGCPGSRTMTFKTEEKSLPKQSQESNRPENRLGQWPCQIKLVPVNAPYFDGANLLIAADCVAYAYANVHEDFMKNKVTIIGCPKLDMVDYSEKLKSIIKNNNIKSVSVLRM